MTTGTYQVVPLEQLHESPLNPRKQFNAHGLEELAASIRAKGILTPLLVRPNADRFEIGAGHRRYRAAKLAGLGTAPCLVQPMTDEEFVEVLTIENLQREDLHPLEEAEGYRQLMTTAHYDVARIAARVGRSVKYVYDRVKLLELTKPAKALFLEGKMTAGHAILLARLSPKDQARACAPDGRALFERETLLFDPNEQGKPYKNGLDGFKAVSVLELDGWIARHVRFDPMKADPMLFPDTVGTIAAAREQAEKIVPITYDSYIQEEAREGRTFGPRSWTRADGKLASKRCELAVTGVVAVGPDRGQAFKVCINKDKCDTHWGKERRAARRRAAGSVGSGRASADTSWQKAEALRKAAREKADALKVRWKKATPEILKTLAAAVKGMAVKAECPIVKIVLAQLPDGHRQDFKAADYLPIGRSPEDLLRYLGFKVLVTEAQEWSAVEDFPRRAKAFGVDASKILEAVAPAPKPTVQTSAKAAKKKVKR